MESLDLPDTPAQVLGDLRCRSEQAKRSGDVEERLVE